MTQKSRPQSFSSVDGNPFQSTNLPPLTGSSFFFGGFGPSIPQHLSCVRCVATDQPAPNQYNECSSSPPPFHPQSVLPLFPIQHPPHICSARFPGSGILVCSRRVHFFQGWRVVDGPLVRCLTETLTFFQQDTLLPHCTFFPKFLAVSGVDSTCWTFRE